MDRKRYKLNSNIDVRTGWQVAHKNRESDGQTDRHAGRQTYKQTDRQSDRHTDRQAGRQANMEKVYRNAG